MTQPNHPVSLEELMNGLQGSANPKPKKKSGAVGKALMVVVGVVLAILLVALFFVISGAIVGFGLGLVFSALSVSGMSWLNLWAIGVGASLAVSGLAWASRIGSVKVSL